MNKLNFKEISNLRNLINNIINFINNLKDDRKQKEALIIIKEVFKNKEVQK